ncbi:uncharacterized protein TRIADDRAFT_60193 [Trichoplax adhaerens]|uniref:Phosphatidylinositol 3,4,5-trisphosphate 5-phosphatase 1/2-like second C2 domain-containing protein n=1 Tax=Trichoplax adhaerens TaxID=10228 RepID=B3S7J9_TRIAD|nr:predicted protein [Trichoplax adhaerens]EDV21303.1 predicted protein [Trichoplax adhaerens]|eukprot:XP_002116270.1 predicted protein [Trichoplax adhaerens]
MDVKSSDHLPVYGLFEADIYHNNIEVWLSIRKSQRPKDWKPKDHLAYIKVISVHVLLKSHQEITESLILEFHSNCLNSPIISGPNKSYWSDNLNVREQQFARFGQKFEDRHQCPEWTIREFSQEEYFKDSDLKYLNGQTLLAILKTSDTKHYKGAGCIPLNLIINQNNKRTPAVDLSYYGKFIGKIEKAWSDILGFFPKNDLGTNASDFNFRDNSYLNDNSIQLDLAFFGND